MGSGLNMRVTITGDRTMFERAAKAFREPKRLMSRIAIAAMKSTDAKLDKVLRADTKAERSGRLAVSIQAFEISDVRAVVGSNLPYAAQVHYGGIIEPKEAKALAIPLTDALKRQGIGPRELDPNRELLRFVPYTGSKPNVFGLLIDPGMQGPLGKRKRKREGGTPYGPGPLFALAWWVSQEARPFLYFDEADLAEINAKIVPQWLDGG